ncbi:MAG: NADH-quinone oxidoreductase subunit A [Puniceicoccaceae bacterium]|nr:MAG: NADH-quinone oxidoreductase subunit A [Puniceicoccaceae bacterium]
MPSDPQAYLTLGIFFGIAVAAALVPIGLSHLWLRWFTPAKPGPSKHSAYECGIEATGPARIQFKSQYYVYGIVFLIFDVEAIFLIPIAVAFLDLPLGAVLVAAVFVLLLLESLAWCWAKGYLNWK